jgi:hypothetical protein
MPVEIIRQGNAFFWICGAKIWAFDLAAVEIVGPGAELSLLAADFRRLTGRGFPLRPGRFP